MLLNRSTEDSYTVSQLVALFRPAINRRAPGPRPMNGAQAGLIRRGSVARPFMAGNGECANVMGIDLVFSSLIRNLQSAIPNSSCDLPSLFPLRLYRPTV